jgi:hypothetical protein
MKNKTAAVTNDKIERKYPFMKTSYSPETLELTVIHRSETPDFFEAEVTEQQEPPAQKNFQSMTVPQKRFHIILYTLAALTGLVVVQVIWQIAELTIQ